MRDSRIVIFRRTLDGLIESLDAAVRVGQWAEEDAVPEPLKDSASHLVARLGAAGRLASGRFSGSVADTARVKAMTDAMRRLDTAYLAYCHGREASPGERDRTATALSAEIDRVRDNV